MVMKLIRKLTLIMTLTFQSVIHLSDQKCRHLWLKRGYKGSPCSSTNQIEDIIDCRNSCGKLWSTKVDLVILGMIQSTINCNEVSYSGRTKKPRQQTRLPLYNHSHRICLKTFLFMHFLCKTGFYSLTAARKVYQAPPSVLPLLNR